MEGALDEKVCSYVRQIAGQGWAEQINALKLYGEILPILNSKKPHYMEVNADIVLGHHK